MESLRRRTRSSSQVVSGFSTPLKAVTSSSSKHLLSAAGLRNRAPPLHGLCPCSTRLTFLKDRDLFKSEAGGRGRFKSDPHAEQKSRCGRGGCSLSAGLADRHCLSLSISRKASRLSGPCGLGRAPALSLQHISAGTISPLSDPPGAVPHRSSHHLSLPLMIILSF